MGNFFGTIAAQIKNIKGAQSVTSLEELADCVTMKVSPSGSSWEDGDIVVIPDTPAKIAQVAVKTKTSSDSTQCYFYFPVYRNREWTTARFYLSSMRKRVRLARKIGETAEGVAQWEANGGTKQSSGTASKAFLSSKNGVDFLTSHLGEAIRVNGGMEDTLSPKFENGQIVPGATEYQRTGVYDFNFCELPEEAKATMPKE